MNHRLTTFALAFALPFAVCAAEAGKPLGADAQHWIELQKSGQQASPAPRPMPGEIADKVYERYVDSFKQPIPAEFKRQSAAGDGTGK